MKTIKEELGKTNQERVTDFEKGAQAFAKKIVTNFKDYEFVGFSQPFFFYRWIQHKLQYVGESMNPEGMVALLNYRVDGITREGTPFSYYSTLTTSTSVAYLTFWKDGLKEVKL